MGARETFFRWLLYILTAVLAAAIVVTGADAYLTFRALGRPPAAIALKPLASSSLSEKKKKKDYAIITRRNLFASDPLWPQNADTSKSPDRAAALKSPARQSPSKTPLNIRLVGTTVGPKGVRYAILETAASRDHVILEKGDRLEGAVIQKIDRAEVRVLYEGELNTLRAFGPKPKAKNSFRSSKIHSHQGARKSHRRFTRKISRARLKRQTQTKAEVKRQIRGVPYQDKYGDLGVRIHPRGRSRLMRLLGLRRGDIVYQIAGLPVRDGAGLTSALMKLPNQNESAIEISRRGKPFEIRFVIR